MYSYVLIMSGIIMVFAIPLLFGFKNYLYKRANLKSEWYEEPIFIIGLITALTIHSMITGSEFSAFLMVGPFAYGNFLLYRHFWKRK